MIFDSLIDAIGHTPLVRLNLLGAAAVYAKLELANPFSMKDRPARHMILQARRSGRLAAGAPIVESSSGSMALGIAVTGRQLGHEVHIVTDPRIDPITLAKLRALGCAVHVVPAMTGAGWQSARLERLAQLLHELPGAFCPRQYTNPDNPAAYATLAEELMADLDHIDLLVGSVGSGGSLCGTARVLRRAGMRVRVVAVDCVGSVLFGQSDRPGRLQSGLGNSVQPANLDRSVIDEVHWLNDREAFAGAEALAGEQQIFGGNTAGSVYRVTRELARTAGSGAVIAAILPDRGDRYAENVFSPDFHHRHGLDSLPDRTRPLRVDYGVEVSAWSYAWLRPPSAADELAVVESNTTGSGMAALAAARDMGLRAALYTTDPGRYRGLSRTGADVVLCDTDDLHAMATRLDGTAAGVTTTSDFYLETVARLAARAGLPGNRPEAVARCRNKAECRRALDRACVPQPRYVAVRSAIEVADAVGVVGLPCVVKPTDDSGSNQVLLCGTVADAVRQVEVILAESHNVRSQPKSGLALVESYVAGNELSVETFSVDGVPTLIGCTARELGAPPHFVELAHFFPAELPAAIAERIRRTVVDALRAVEFAWGPAHTEVRVGEDGEVSVIEINARLAGGMIPELVRLAHGVDLVRQQLCACTGAPVHLRPTLDRHAGIRFLTADRPGVLRAVHGVSHALRIPGVVEVELTREVGTEVRVPRNAYDRLGFLLAAADSADDVRATMAQAHALIELDVVEESTA